MTPGRGHGVIEEDPRLDRAQLEQLIDSLELAATDPHLADDLEPEDSDRLQQACDTLAEKLRWEPPPPGALAYFSNLMSKFPTKPDVFVGGQGKDTEVIVVGDDEAIVESTAAAQEKLIRKYGDPHFNLLVFTNEDLGNRSSDAVFGSTHRRLNGAARTPPGA